jgi:hypothetical protein
LRYPQFIFPPVGYVYPITPYFQGITMRKRLQYAVIITTNTGLTYPNIGMSNGVITLTDSEYTPTLQNVPLSGVLADRWCSAITSNVDSQYGGNIATYQGFELTCSSKANVLGKVPTIIGSPVSIKIYDGQNHQKF